MTDLKFSDARFSDHDGQRQFADVPDAVVVNLALVLKRVL